MFVDDLWWSTATSTTTLAVRKYFEKILSGALYQTKHPVVRVHPETGERVIVLGNFVQRFIGVQKYSGRKLFDLLHPISRSRKIPCVMVG